MKRALVMMLLLVSCIAVAQEDPIPPKRSKAAKIGGLFGYTPGWLFLDVAPINNFLLAAKGAAFKDQGMYMNGIGGAAFIMFVPNLRVGGLGMNGTLTSTSLVAGVRRDAELAVSFGGVTIEYVIPIAERLDFTVGAMLGGGGLEVTLRQHDGSALTWNQEWGNYETGNYNLNGKISNITRKFDGSFYVYVPSLNLEYGILGWVGVRLGVSYVGMFSPTWRVDGNYDLLGVPDNIHGKGFMVNAGLFVGTF
ncbi:MAG: hypothetical protein HY961_21730 [Ignavibacteriae bacterium]|nr:hypothetical protein [Ignavibacteriota bacterium]